MATERPNRVAEAIRQEIAQILQREVKDPRIGFITVTRVKVSPDLRHAKIYFSLLEGHGDAARTEEGLRSSQGYIRRLLGDRLKMRVTPEVVFHLDPSVAESIRISRILGSAGETPHPGDSSDENG